MKFNTTHKNHKGFKAIKWLISKAQYDHTNTLEYQGIEIESVLSSFDGNLPHRMIADIRDLTKLGYRGHNVDTSFITYWVTEKSTYEISIHFNQFNANKIEFYYSVSSPNDGSINPDFLEMNAAA